MADIFFYGEDRKLAPIEVKDRPSAAKTAKMKTASSSVSKAFPSALKKAPPRASEFAAKGVHGNVASAPPAKTTPRAGQRKVAFVGSKRISFVEGPPRDEMKKAPVVPSADGFPEKKDWETMTIKSQYEFDHLFDCICEMSRKVKQKERVSLWSNYLLFCSRKHSNFLANYFQRRADRFFDAQVLGLIEELNWEAMQKFISDLPVDTTS